LDAALFGVSGLFDSNHLPLHLGEFSGCLFVAADKERGWLEDDNSGGGSQTVVGSLLILNAG
jgi:hypothetical protein